MADLLSAGPGSWQPPQSEPGPASTPRFVPLPPTQVSVCVVGAGYVGLTAAAGLAFLGHTVVCTDISAGRVERLRDGECPLVEEGLPELLASVRDLGRLSFTTDNKSAAADADFVFMCLPTPQGEDGAADLSRVCEVAEEIGPHLRPGTIVVNKSTVPAGTSRLVGAALLRNDVWVVSNPEFLAEGTAVKDFLRPDRVVIGADDRSAGERVAALYDALDAPILLTDATSAEVVKYAANACLAVRLSFVNSIAELCEPLGADALAVMEGIGLDRRIGSSFLKPGPGWGGSCFPKDTTALVHTAEQHGVDLSLVRAAIWANQQHHAWLVDKIVSAADDDLSGRTIALWGLAFKAGTDDVRDSAALSIGRALISRGARVQAYDPAVTSLADDIELTVCASAVEACTGADLLFISTEWPEFTEVDLAEVWAVMDGPTIVDGRNLIDPVLAARIGFRYEGLGHAAPHRAVAAGEHASEDLAVSR